MKNFEHLIKIIAPVIAISVAWGIIQARIDDYDKRLTKIESKMEQLDGTFLKIEVKLAEIQKDIQSINKKLDE